MKKILEKISPKDKEMIFQVLVVTFVMYCFAAVILMSVVYETEVTKIYNVEKFKVYESGVEVWANNQDGKNGFFFENNDVYLSDDVHSKVISLYRAYDTTKGREIGQLKRAYLYLNEEDYETYKEEFLAFPQS